MTAVGSLIEMDSLGQWVTKKNENVLRGKADRNFRQNLKGTESSRKDGIPRELQGNGDERRQLSSS